MNEDNCSHLKPASPQSSWKINTIIPNRTQVD